MNCFKNKQIAVEVLITIRYRSSFSQHTHDNYLFFVIIESKEDRLRNRCCSSGRRFIVICRRWDVHFSVYHCKCRCHSPIFATGSLWCTGHVVQRAVNACAANCYDYLAPCCWTKKTTVVILWWPFASFIVGLCWTHRRRLLAHRVFRIMACIKTYCNIKRYYRLHSSHDSFYSLYTLLHFPTHSYTNNEQIRLSNKQTVRCFSENLFMVNRIYRVAQNKPDYSNCQPSLRKFAWNPAFYTWSQSRQFILLWRRSESGFTTRNSEVVR